METKLPEIEAPEKPCDTCEVCGTAFKYFHDETNWTSGSEFLQRLDRNSALFRSLYWTREEHKQCAAEYTRRMKEKRINLIRQDRREVVAKWRSNAALPIDVAAKTFGTLEVTDENKDAIRLIRAWKPTDDFGLLLLGPAGTGKSHVGFSVCNQILEDYVNAPIEFDESDIYRDSTPDWTSHDSRLLDFPYYQCVAKMLSDLRGDNDSKVISRVESAKICFLDDLGSENVTDWSREIFFRIFETRLNRRLPTIVTSNLSLDELKQRLHERTVSRILGLCVPITIKGRDFRQSIIKGKLKALKERVSV